MRKGDWIKTYSGIKFYPLDPRPEEILIEDIAHALSNICRFTGHCNHFYSVAQHSLLVSEYADTLLNKKIGLLHDASEAYISDVSRPLKRSFGFEEYLLAEKYLQGQILKKFGLPEEISTEVKEIDTRLLYTEGRDLMGGTSDWHDGNSIVPYSEKIIYMSPYDIEVIFLNEFKRLFMLDEKHS